MADFTDILSRPVADALEVIRKEAYQAGYEEGYQAGYVDGFDNGFIYGDLWNHKDDEY